MSRYQFTKGRDVAIAALFSIFLVSTIFTVLVSNAQLPIITQMNDTTATSGLKLYQIQPIHAEYVSPTSVLVGKKIDTIQLSLKKFGNPTGNAYGPDSDPIFPWGIVAAPNKYYWATLYGDDALVVGHC